MQTQLLKLAWFLSVLSSAVSAMVRQAFPQNPPPGLSVQLSNGYDAVKWCNARNEKEGRVAAYYTNDAQTGVYRSGRFNLENDWVNGTAGYRLPTEAAWEKAATGGVSGRRFTWPDVDMISHGRAN